MQLSDLLAGCQREDAQAQRILYDLYKARLMGLCRRYTAHREEAQDVLQDAFIKIFRSIKHITQAEKLDGWMKTIVVNTAIDHYHRSKKHRHQEINENVTSHLPALENPTNSDELLVLLINQLPDRCRLVFNLYVADGYSHAEIADLLQISEGTSRSQLNYAKTLLKEKLKCHDLAQYYGKFV